MSNEKPARCDQGNQNLRNDLICFLLFFISTLPPSWVFVISFDSLWSRISRQNVHLTFAKKQNNFVTYPRTADSLYRKPVIDQLNHGGTTFGRPIIRAIIPTGHTNRTRRRVAHQSSLVPNQKNLIRCKEKVRTFNNCTGKSKLTTL